MRDFTTNNYCDFLWINDLLALKKDSKNVFTGVFQKNQKSTSISVGNVEIFGTIVEVKQIASKGFIYHVDDGTGVIACKHSEGQFEELLSVIESEHRDALNESMQFRNQLEETLMTDASSDALFSERSIQADETDINRKSNLMGLQSIWDDLFQDFSSLMQQYSIGDSVVVQGRLYNYFHINQLYVNTIRPMGFKEEIMRVDIKLEDGYNATGQGRKSNSESRLSGLMTFDTIPHLNPKFVKPVHVLTPEVKEKYMGDLVVTPHLDSNMTFDTFVTNS